MGPEETALKLADYLLANVSYMTDVERIELAYAIQAWAESEDLDDLGAADGR